MPRTRSRSRTLTLAVAAAGALALGACGSPNAAPAGGGGDSEDGAPVQVGLVYSKSGPLATYGAQYLQGFEAGLDYATDGTGEVDGREIEVIEGEPPGDPPKAAAGPPPLSVRGP